MCLPEFERLCFFVVFFIFYLNRFSISLVGDPSYKPQMSGVEGQSITWLFTTKWEDSPDRTTWLVKLEQPRVEKRGCWIKEDGVEHVVTTAGNPVVISPMDTHTYKCQLIDLLIKWKLHGQPHLEWQTGRQAWSYMKEYRQTQKHTYIKKKKTG